MIKEYALDPSLLRNWKDVRFYLGLINESQGRVISRYPKRWPSLVKQGVRHDDSIGDTEKKRIEVQIDAIKDRLLRRLNRWDSSLDWLENAEIEHERTAFDGILSLDNPRDNPHVLVGEETDHTLQAWSTTAQLVVERKAELMSETVATMFRNSKEIAFVDPHFRPDAPRYRLTLEKFLRTALRETSSISRIRYFCKMAYSPELFVEECLSLLPRHVPQGLAIEVITLKERDKGEKLHDRFILTNRWGVAFSVGLDAGSPGQTTLINLLSEDVWSNTWRKYCSQNPAFDMTGNPTVIVGVA